jgi:hypothetical protein
MPHTNLLERIRGEYLEMPGLRLTLDQARRLWGVDRVLCQIVLDRLVAEQFLCVKADGRYLRVTDGVDQQYPRAARAQLRGDTRVANAS